MESENDDKGKRHKYLESRGYKIEGVIGRGSTCIVYKVFSERYAMNFAAKIFGNKGQYLDKFYHEAEIINSLIHPNVVRIYDTFVADNDLIIVEDFHEHSLESLIPQNGFERPKLITLFHGILSGIDYIHSQGISHCDIKPLNILVDAFGRPVLCDFGLAQIANKTELMDTFPGTFAFKSPQVLERKKYDALKADIWSLGVTLFVMATGKLPWDQKNSTDMKLDICQVRIQPSRNLDPDISRLIGQMLSYNPNSRPSTTIILQNPLFLEIKPKESKRRHSSVSRFITAQSVLSIQKSVSHPLRPRIPTASPSFSNIVSNSLINTCI